MNLAQLVIVGNVTGDPDSRRLADGRCRTRFRVAATRRTLDPNSGRWRDGDTTFLAVVAWRGLAELAARLQTGDRAVVLGHPRLCRNLPKRSYEPPASMRHDLEFAPLRNGVGGAAPLA